MTDFEVRERLGEDSWLWLEDEDDFAMVEEEAMVLRAAAVDGATDGLLGFCGCNSGSGGGSFDLGDSEMPLRFPSEAGAFEDVGAGFKGGEYCVPASVVIFDEDVVDLDKVLLCDLGDGGRCREKAAGGGGLI